MVVFSSHNVCVSRLRQQPTTTMRQTALAEIIRDTDIVSAIRPVVVQRHLTLAETRDALITLHVPRAAQIAALVTTP